MFSRDGATLACVAADGTVRLWESPGAKCLVSVRFGEAAGALAMPNGVIAVALGHAVCFRALKTRDERLITTTISTAP